MQFWILHTNYSIPVFSFVTTYVAILQKFHSFFVIFFTFPYLCLKEKCFFHLNQARLSSSLLCLISLIKILQYRILCGTIFHKHKVFKTIPVYCLLNEKICPLLLDCGRPISRAFLWGHISREYWAEIMRNRGWIKKSRLDYISK